MKKYIFSAICLATLSACGVNSTDLPTSKHSMSYYQEFENTISEELSAEDHQVVKRFMRRVKDYKEGTSVGDALDQQKVFEEKQRQRIKAERETAFKKLNQNLSKLKSDVDKIKAELEPLKTKEAADKYIADNTTVKVAFLENRNNGGVTTNQVYTIDIRTSPLFDLLSTEMTHTDENGQEKSARHDIRLDQLEKNNKGEYTLERELMTIYQLGGVKEEPTVTKFTPKVLGASVKTSHLYSQFTPSAIAKYLKELDARVNTLENVKEKFATEGKYSPERVDELWKQYGSTAWKIKSSNKGYRGRW